MDYIDVNVMEVAWVGVDWLCLSVDMIHCHRVVRTVAIFQIP
jgi:hypothetical protein